MEWVSLKWETIFAPQSNEPGGLEANIEHRRSDDRDNGSNTAINPNERRSDEHSQFRKVDNVRST